MTNHFVVRGLCHNPNLPFRVLRVLTEDKRLWAQTYDAPPEVLTELSLTANLVTRNGVARNPNTPKAILEYLSTAPDLCVRDFVSRNPSTPVSVLEKLSTDSHWSVRYHAAANPNTPVDVLEQLMHDQDSWVVNAARASLILRNQ